MGDMLEPYALDPEGRDGLMNELRPREPWCPEVPSATPHALREEPHMARASGDCHSMLPARKSWAQWVGP